MTKHASSATSHPSPSMEEARDPAVAKNPKHVSESNNVARIGLPAAEEEFHDKKSNSAVAVALAPKSSPVSISAKLAVVSKT